MNVFYDKNGKDRLSKLGGSFIDKLLNRGPEICLVFNSSENTYRKPDLHFEAPNQIKASANDRRAMIRIPLGNVFAFFLLTWKNITCYAYA